jgi:biopolymer transport protein ExbD
MSVGGGGGEGDVYINLTPAIDILTCLLFFLLLGYKSQAETVAGAEELELPTSISEKGLVLSLSVTATLDAVHVENQKVLTLQDGNVRDRDLDGERITSLYSFIKQVLEKEKAGGLKIDKSAILLAADKRLKSGTVIKILKTCGMAGIPNFRFAVSKQ